MGKKDYILRSKAIKAVTGWETDPTDDELEMALSNVPSADVVEVVRCKDCKHSEEFIYPEGLETMVCWEDNADREVNRNGFCEKGERKND